MTEVNGATGVSLVLATAPEADARRLADALLGERLIACANLVGPVTSRFWWQGALDEAREVLLLMKTRRDLVPALRDRLLQLHPYEVAEVLAFDVAAGAERYLQWVLDSCRPPP